MPLPFALDPRRTALLVIDMQNFFIAEGAPCEAPAGRALLPSLNRLVARCRAAGVRVIYTRQRHDRMNDVYRQLFPAHFQADGTPLLAEGSHWHALHPDLAPGADLILDKDRYSAFYNTSLEQYLRSHGVENLIIAGVATNVCCESTARDAFFRDFKVLFLSDGNATVTDEMQRGALQSIAMAFGWVVSVADVEAALNRW